MVIKLNCKKSDVIVSDVTRVNSPERKQAIFFEKLLEKLHEVTIK